MEDKVSLLTSEVKVAKESPEVTRAAASNKAVVAGRVPADNRGNSGSLGRV